MKKNVYYIALSCFSIAATGCITQQSMMEQMHYGMMGKPQIFEDLGTHTRQVSTKSPEAATYVEQGINWMYSFNHDEAVRSFTHATEIDPNCAMAWWGIAYAQGPNYNAPEMTPGQNSAAYAALQKATECIEHASPVERALIEALQHRYTEPAPEERDELNAAFCDAMAAVYERFPDDSDVGTFYAESIMVQYPWVLYTRDSRPAGPYTHKAVRVLEDVLSRDPDNPGANHLYIHAIEPSQNKQRAVAAADRLSNLVPASGHLRHMPSHIYAQVGMWDRSIQQNELATRADDRYRQLSPEQLSQHGYMAHNAHMLAFSAMMVGRERVAMAAARDMWNDIDGPSMRMAGPFLDSIMCSIYDVQKRFGRWDDLLAEPAPPSYMPITTAVWRAHRAIAYAAKKDFDNAQRERKAFRKAMRNVPEGFEARMYGTNVKFLLVSELFIEGEIALQKGKWDEAARILEEAVEIEDALGYGEPPMWLQPVRHTLGAVYLSAGNFAEAERVYRDDLSKWPGNGWSLYGLMRSLEGQGKTTEVATVRQQFNAAWAEADEPIQTSCKCIQKV